MAHETFNPEELEAGPYTSLIDALVEADTRSIPVTYSQKEQIQGRLCAVELCRELRIAERNDFEDVLLVMSEEDVTSSSIKEENMLAREDYSLHHVATEQFRLYCEILRVAEHDLMDTEAGADEPNNAIAKVRYRILKEKAGYIT